MPEIVKRKQAEKMHRGSGICPDSAEQNAPSNSQNLPNQFCAGGMLCFARPVPGCQNRYWVTSIHSVMTGGKRRISGFRMHLI